MNLKLLLNSGHDFVSHLTSSRCFLVDYMLLLLLYLILTLYNICNQRDTSPLSTMHVMQDDARQILASPLPISLQTRSSRGRRPTAKGVGERYQSLHPRTGLEVDAFAHATILLNISSGTRFQKTLSHRRPRVLSRDLRVLI